MFLRDLLNFADNGPFYSTKNVHGVGDPGIGMLYYAPRSFY